MHNPLSCLFFTILINFTMAIVSIKHNSILCKFLFIAKLSKWTCIYYFYLFYCYFTLKLLLGCYPSHVYNFSLLLL